MRKAEAAVLAQEEMEVGLLVKDFFDGPVEAVLQQMAGSGGRRPAAAEARGAARQARAAGAAGGGRAPPPLRTLPAGGGYTRAERAAAALAAEMEGLARARRDVVRRRRQVQLNDAPLVAAADETAVWMRRRRAGRARPTRPGEATARRARGSVAEGRARTRTTAGRVPTTRWRRA